MGIRAPFFWGVVRAFSYARMSRYAVGIRAAFDIHSARSRGKLELIDALLWAIEFADGRVTDKSLIIGKMFLGGGVHVEL